MVEDTRHTNSKVIKNLIAVGCLKMKKQILKARTQKHRSLTLPQGTAELY